LARRPKTGQALAMRARIVLGCSDGLSNGEVAKRLRITAATVCKWRERFRVDRLEGLLDEPRPGAPRSITDAQVEDVITWSRRTPRFRILSPRDAVSVCRAGRQDRPGGRQ